MSMNVPQILKQVELTIQTKEEREYFLIHEARYDYILSHLGDLGHLGDLRSRKEKPRVLDVGCFPYHLGKAMEILGYDVYGIASSHEPIKSTKIRVCNIETDKFPFKDNFFDLVVCTEVLEHLPQSPARTIGEMYRVTKPQGRLLITTPNIARSINRIKMLLGKSVTYPLSQVLENEGKGSNLYHRHNREYTLGEVSTLLSHKHWIVDMATYFVSYTPFRRRVHPDSIVLKIGKIANYLVMTLMPSLRDTLLVVGRKNLKG